MSGRVQGGATLGRAPWRAVAGEGAVDGAGEGRGGWC